eukprot:tig00000881_g5234.t1
MAGPSEGPGSAPVPIRVQSVALAVVLSADLKVLGCSENFDRRHSDLGKGPSVAELLRKGLSSLLADSSIEHLAETVTRLIAVQKIKAIGAPPPEDEKNGYDDPLVLEAASPEGEEFTGFVQYRDDEILLELDPTWSLSDNDRALRKRRSGIRYAAEMMMATASGKKRTSGSSTQNAGTPVARSVSPVLQTLSAEDEESLLCAQAVDAIFELTGYDRVCVYRLQENYHGQVLAERLSDPSTVPSYLNLFFPAGDIPSKQRKTFALRPLRMIVDTEAPPCRIMRLSEDGSSIVDAPLKPSFLPQFASVHPCHATYMRNMGTPASMSATVLAPKPAAMVGEISEATRKMWGLIVCHHRTAKVVDWHTRADCMLVADALGAALERLYERKAVAGERRAADVNGALMLRVATPAAMAGPVKDSPLLGVVDESAGAAVVRNGRVVEMQGRCPPEDFILDLCDWMRKSGLGPIWHSDCLSQHMEAGRRVSNVAAGVLMVRVLGGNPGLSAGAAAAAQRAGSPSNDQQESYMMWFRPEKRAERLWAGQAGSNHAAGGGTTETHVRSAGPAEAAAGASKALCTTSGPRSSFDPQSEIVTLHSKSFSVEDLGAAQAVFRILNSLDADFLARMASFQLAPERAAMRGMPGGKRPLALPPIAKPQEDPDLDHLRPAKEEHATLLEAHPSLRYSKTAAVGLLELTGCGALSERVDPLTYAEKLAELFAVLDAVAAQHGVERIKVSGEVYVMGAGTAAANPGDKPPSAAAAASSAVRCALAMREAIAQRPPLFGVKVGLRAGVHVGPLALGPVAGGERPQVEAYGPALRTALELLSSSASSRVHVSQVVKDQLPAAEFALEPAGAGAPQEGASGASGPGALNSLMRFFGVEDSDDESRAAAAAAAAGGEAAPGPNAYATSALMNQPAAAARGSAPAPATYYVECLAGAGACIEARRGSVASSSGGAGGLLNSLSADEEEGPGGLGSLDSHKLSPPSSLSQLPAPPGTLRPIPATPAGAPGQAAGAVHPTAATRALVGHHLSEHHPTPSGPIPARRKIPSATSLGPAS